jgi:hypothetical protein
MAGAMFTQTNSYLDNLKRDLPAGAIAWLYMWDIIRDVFTEIEDGSAGYDLIPVPGVDLEAVWDKFEKYPWGGFDVIEDDVLNWLSAEDLIQEYEEEDE